MRKVFMSWLHYQFKDRIIEWKPELWDIRHRLSICSVVLSKLSQYSLGIGDAIWRWRSWSTLVQVMACCLTAPSHYLNQIWLIISKVLWHIFNYTYTTVFSLILCCIAWVMFLLCMIRLFFYWIYARCTWSKMTEIKLFNQSIIHLRTLS